jgi:hypothetical protein
MLGKKHIRVYNGTVPAIQDATLFEPNNLLSSIHNFTKEAATSTGSPATHW